MISPFLKYSLRELLALKSTHLQKEGRSRNTSFCRCPLCLFASITKFYLPANTGFEELPLFTLHLLSPRQSGPNVFLAALDSLFLFGRLCPDRDLNPCLDQEDKKDQVWDFCASTPPSSSRAKTRVSALLDFFVGAPRTFLRLTDERHRLTPMRAANAPWGRLPGYLVWDGGETNRCTITI